MSRGWPAADDVFTGLLSSFAGLLVRGPVPRSRPAAHLADLDVLREHLILHHIHVGGDWRAACSVWSQHYFRTLIIPAVSLVLLRREPMPLDPAGLEVILCPDRGVPLAFVLGAVALPGPAEPLVSLLELQLAPLIDALTQVGRLSPKLIWENAAWPLAFALKTAIERRPACAGTAIALLDRPNDWPASRYALANVRSFAFAGLQFERRLCCMRDRVPGLLPCACQCPKALIVGRKLTRCTDC